MSLTKVEKEYTKTFDEWAEANKEVVLLKARLEAIRYPLRRVNIDGVEFDAFRELIAKLQDDIYTAENLLSKKDRLLQIAIDNLKTWV